jgi:hypothetical protein
MRTVDVEPEAMVGRSLTAVSSSWHELEGHRSKEPVHLWLSVDGLGTLRLHTLDGLVITRDAVSAPYDLGEHGRVVVEPSGPAPLMERVGEPIEAVSRLEQFPPGASVGVLLDFPGGSVGIADLGDELVVASWPADVWPRLGVSARTDG